MVDGNVHVLAANIIYPALYVLVVAQVVATTSSTVNVTVERDIGRAVTLSQYKTLVAQSIVED